MLTQSLRISPRTTAFPSCKQPSQVQHHAHQAQSGPTISSACHGSTRRTRARSHMTFLTRRKCNGLQSQPARRGPCGGPSGAPKCKVALSVVGEGGSTSAGSARYGNAARVLCLKRVVSDDDVGWAYPPLGGNFALHADSLPVRVWRTVGQALHWAGFSRSCCNCWGRGLACSRCNSLLICPWDGTA